MVNICQIKEDAIPSGKMVEGEALDPMVGTKSVIGSLSFVDRFLSLWIITVMVIGVVVGYYSPETQEGLARIEGTIGIKYLASQSRL